MRMDSQVLIEIPALQCYSTRKHLWHRCWFDTQHPALIQYKKTSLPQVVIWHSTSSPATVQENISATGVDLTLNIQPCHSTRKHLCHRCWFDTQHLALLQYKKHLCHRCWFDTQHLALLQYKKTSLHRCWFDTQQMLALCQLSVDFMCVFLLICVCFEIIMCVVMWPDWLASHSQIHNFV